MKHCANCILVAFVAILILVLFMNIAMTIIREFEQATDTELVEPYFPERDFFSE
jgi:hypothetical protein